MAGVSPVHVTLEFNQQQLTVGEDATDIRSGLSGVVLFENDLWLACDEGCRIERLSRVGPTRFASHEMFPLDQLVRLPAGANEEADIEGMDVDAGFVWLVGSHSVKRKKAKPGDSPAAVAKKLATTSRDGNRHLLARIPIVDRMLRAKDGQRHSAALDASPSTSALLDAVVAPDDAAAADPDLAPFVALPGKDNGFDIEGLAVNGKRAFVGLRGPVLREWCCILELTIEEQGKRLVLEPGDDGALFRKHFLKLNGLGVRDLVIHGNDLLVLSGPTMGHDGPSVVWRWKGGARPGAEVAGSDVTAVLTLPQREGFDRAEGMTLFEGGAAASVLVVYDTPADERLSGDAAVTADVYRV